MSLVLIGLVMTQQYMLLLLLLLVMHMVVGHVGQQDQQQQQQQVEYLEATRLVVALLQGPTAAAVLCWLVRSCHTAIPLSS
jgi:hypothetical protein